MTSIWAYASERSVQRIAPFGFFAGLDASSAGSGQKTSPSPFSSPSPSPSPSPCGIASADDWHATGTPLADGVISLGFSVLSHSIQPISGDDSSFRASFTMSSEILRMLAICRADIGRPSLLAHDPRTTGRQVADHWQIAKKTPKACTPFAPWLISSMYPDESTPVGHRNHPSLTRFRVSAFSNVSFQFLIFHMSLIQ